MASVRFCSSDAIAADIACKSDADGAAGLDALSLLFLLVDNRGRFGEGPSDSSRATSARGARGGDRDSGGPVEAAFAFVVAVVVFATAEAAALCINCSEF